MPVTPQFRKLMALLAELHLGRDDRHELATMILNRDITTYAELPENDVSRLLDAAAGYIYISHLVATMPPYEAGIPADTY